MHFLVSDPVCMAISYGTLECHGAVVRAQLARGGRSPLLLQVLRPQLFTSPSPSPSPTPSTGKHCSSQVFVLALEKSSGPFLGHRFASWPSSLVSTRRVFQERKKMDPLLTPTTALLHSLLEPSAFESPTPPQNPAPREPDVFSRSFAEHNNAQAQSLQIDLSNGGLWKHQGNGCASTINANTWVASAEHYITPPGTISIASEATASEQELFQLRPPLTSVLAFSPISPLDEESFDSIQDWPVPSRPFTATKSVT